MCVQIFHLVNIDVPADVGAPPLDTQLPVMSMWLCPHTIKVSLPPLYLWCCSCEKNKTKKETTRLSMDASTFWSMGAWERGYSATAMLLRWRHSTVHCCIYDSVSKLKSGNFPLYQNQTN